MVKRKSIILILNKEDKMHEWILYDFARRKNLPIRTILAEPKELRRMRYVSILDRRELVYIQDEDKNILKHLPDILKVNTQKRILAVSADTKELVKRLKTSFKKERVEEFPELKDYQQKKKQVLRILQRWGMECVNQEVERALVRNMIRDVASWEEVKLVWEIYAYRNKKMDRETLAELFPDDEFHNLEGFIIGILQGKWKKKGVQQGYYFLETKEYNASWLIKRIQSTYLDIGLFYQAYRGGVILIPENNGRLLDRINGLGWEKGLRLAEFKEHEQERYLDVVKEMPYKHYIRITKYVMGVSERGSKEDVYQMIENIKKVRGELSDAWDAG